MQLLLKCARTRIDEATAARIRELARGTIDWARVIDLAQRHGVLPLVYRSVHAACRGAVPESVLGRLQIDYHRNLARNLVLTHELLRVLALLNAEGVDAIPFKGPVLAAAVYGDLALRQAGDLDLLVRLIDFVKAKDILLGEGYTPQVDLSPTQAWNRLPGNGQYDFIAPATRIPIELHWDVTSAHFATNFDLMGIWKRLRHVDLAGTEVLTLCPEDTLLTLCAHGSKHIWSRLAWVCDVAEMVRDGDDLDWDIILESARSVSCERLLSLGLTLAESLLDARMPQIFLTDMRRDRRVLPIANSLADRLLAEPPRHYTDLQVTFIRYRFRERVLDGFKDTFRLIFCPHLADWTFWRLPAVWSFLYPLLRPFRLGIEFIVRPLLSGLRMPWHGRGDTNGTPRRAEQAESGLGE
jgi:hypothetical protein